MRYRCTCNSLSTYITSKPLTAGTQQTYIMNLGKNANELYTPRVTSMMYNVRKIEQEFSSRQFMWTQILISLHILFLNKHTYKMAVKNANLYLSIINTNYRSIILVTTKYLLRVPKINRSPYVNLRIKLKKKVMLIFFRVIKQHESGTSGRQFYRQFSEQEARACDGLISIINRCPHNSSVDSVCGSLA